MKGSRALRGGRVKASQLAGWDFNLRPYSLTSLETPGTLYPTVIADQSKRSEFNDQHVRLSIAGWRGEYVSVSVRVSLSEGRWGGWEGLLVVRAPHFVLAVSATLRYPPATKSQSSSTYEHRGACFKLRSVLGPDYQAVIGLRHRNGSSCYNYLPSLGPWMSDLLCCDVLSKDLRGKPPKCIGNEAMKPGQPARQSFYWLLHPAVSVIMLLHTHGD